MSLDETFQKHLLLRHFLYKLRYTDVHEFDPDTRLEVSLDNSETDQQS